VIVHRQDGQLVLIHQLDHSGLSGAFTRHWGHDRFERPAALETVALASARHDEGWRHEDDKPLYDPDTKRPLHFRDVDVRAHAVFYKAGVERIIALDPYAGLLVSMHYAGLYQGRYGAGPVRMTKVTSEVRPVTDAIVAEQEAVQAALKRRLWNPSQRRSEFERRLWTHYELIQAWDFLSLFVCLNDLSRPAGQRIGTVPLAIDGPAVELSVQTTGDRTITVDPYPFDVPRLEAVIPARAIPDRPYETPEEFHGAVREAHDASIRCAFVPATPATRQGMV